MRRLDFEIPVGHQRLTRLTNLCERECVSKCRVFDIAFWRTSRDQNNILRPQEITGSPINLSFGFRTVTAARRTLKSSLKEVIFLSQRIRAPRNLLECLSIERPMLITKCLQDTHRIVTNPIDNDPIVRNIESGQVLMKIAVIGERLVAISDHNTNQ